LPRGYIPPETSIHFMKYHFVWTPKYRRKVIVGDVEKD
jgi:REP element-mobilizing transposase RayT